MDPDSAAAAGGQEQLPEHATVARPRRTSADGATAPSSRVLGEGVVLDLISGVVLELVGGGVVLVVLGGGNIA
jgi:hypothetical protein